MGTFDGLGAESSVAFDDGAWWFPFLFVIFVTVSFLGVFLFLGALVL